MLLLKWMAVPSAVLAIAVLLTSAGWSERCWVVAGYCAIALPALILWRRATYRLVPSARTMRGPDLDPRRKRQLTNRFILTFGMSLLVMIGAVLCVFFVPSARTESGFFMFFTLFVWTSLVKFGVFNVLAHPILTCMPPPIDLPPRQ